MLIGWKLICRRDVPPKPCLHVLYGRISADPLSHCLYSQLALLMFKERVDIPVPLTVSKEVGGRCDFCRRNVLASRRKRAQQCESETLYESSRVDEFFRSNDQCFLNTLAISFRSWLPLWLLRSKRYWFEPKSWLARTRIVVLATVHVVLRRRVADWRRLDQSS